MKGDKMKQVLAVVGAQFGSEGKGMVVEKLARDFAVHVRTGAPNAGHTYYIDSRVDVTPMGDPKPQIVAGERLKVVARSVPVGAANPDANLVIGPGAVISLDALLDEVRELDALGLQVSDRLFVDENAMLIDPIRHHVFEGGVDGKAHHKIGSTGEGVGPARMARIARGTLPHPTPAWSLIESVAHYRVTLEDEGIAVTDTALSLNRWLDAGATILLEGTQGSGLSLVHGVWPYVTSTDTNAAQLAVDAGLAPQCIDEVLLVARTHPIRVAGNSGPLPNETTWEGLEIEPEHTTVTKKVRRVANLYSPAVRRAVMLNRPSSIALTFADYWWPELAGRSNIEQGSQDFVHSQVARVEEEFDCPVSLLGTGPDSVIWLRPEAHGAYRTAPWPSWREAYGLVQVPA